MSGKGNAGHHLSGFPMPPYSYFFPHVLGGLSPPPLPGLPISGYSTPSPARKEEGVHSWTCSTGASSRPALRFPFGQLPVLAASVHDGDGGPP
ncbi:hypothetical protein COCON_G00033050 [Conger conger]|uniref:Retinoic acid receptor alpha n=1 Tax=Conger conger TaxID=82655 RepID=A0A9Q1DZ10_CONCO|nr:hypothetical protein COCON_G00033050 [Conger conger]